jgi:hypothetical protein
MDGQIENCEMKFLIIKNCGECPFRARQIVRKTIKAFCSKTNDYLKNDAIPNNCPLNDLPHQPENDFADIPAFLRRQAD